MKFDSKGVMPVVVIFLVAVFLSDVLGVPDWLVVLPMAVVGLILTVLGVMAQNALSKPSVRYEPNGVFFVGGLGQTMGRLIPHGAALDVQVWHPEQLSHMRLQTAAHKYVIHHKMPALVIELRDPTSIVVRGGWLSRFLYRLSDGAGRRGMGSEGADNIILEMVKMSPPELRRVADLLTKAPKR